MLTRIRAFALAVRKKLLGQATTVKSQAVGGAIGISRRLVVRKIAGGARQEGSSENIGEQIVAIRRMDDQITAVRIADSDGHAVSANLNEDGSVDDAIRGRSRQGEDGTLAVCRLLIERLRMEGGRCGEPRMASRNSRDERGIDAIVQCDASTLSIQVVRADPDPEVWKTLGQTGETSRRMSPAEAAHVMQRAIEKKAGRIAFAQRAELLLALDATETPGQTLAQSVDAFRSDHATWASSLGFASIWLVGPNVTLTQRLA